MRPKPTALLSHSALRRSNTTALQQLPVGDHGGRMNTQMKGSVVGECRLSARLKKWEALRPHTSARPSSLSNAVERKGQEQLSPEAITKWVSSATITLDLLFHLNVFLAVVYCLTYVLHCTKTQCPASQQLQNSLSRQLWKKRDVPGKNPTKGKKHISCFVWLYLIEVTVPFKKPQGARGWPSVPETDPSPYTGVLVNNVPQLGVNL